MGGRRLWIVIGAIALLGLALRIAAAQGGLWLDEAWSAVMAHRVGTPLGVFLNINHDNNHHLNTLWLLAVGPGAPPVVQRGLSILSGTAAILVAGAIGARQGVATAICAALLFAVSPLLVTYGAEARGYAPMVLALLGAVLVTARWLDDPARPVPAAGLFLVVLLGMFSQMTMAFGVAALAVWAAGTLYRTQPRREAVAGMRRLLVPLLFPVVMVPALVLGAAALSGTGFQLGNSDAFRLAVAWDGISKAAIFAIGVGVVLVPVFAAQGVLAAWGRPLPDKSWGFFALAALIPLGVVLLGLPNAGMPRYHLIGGVALVMLAASLAGGWFTRGRRLAPALVLMALLIGDALHVDRRIILDQRADPGRAVAAMADGGDVAVDRLRAAAVMEAAIASGHRALRVAEAPCPAARYLFVDRDGDEPFPAQPTRCGSTYRLIAAGHPHSLSGTHWTLYERR